MKGDFKSRLQEALVATGMLASELAEKTGISEANISNYIKGKYVAKQDKCYLLAKALDVDPGWLMTGDEKTIFTTSELMDSNYYENTFGPKTNEAKILAKGIDKMPKAQREAILNMMSGLYPGLFEKGKKDDDT